MSKVITVWHRRIEMSGIPEKIGARFSSGTEMRPFRRFFPLIWAFFCLPARLVAVGDVLLDPFDDGSRFDAADPSDVDWYEVSGVSTISVVNDSAGIGSGNAMEVVTSGSAKVLGSFPPVHLSEIGQSLRLSLDFRLVSVVSVDEWLRFGLYDSGGTAFTGDNAGTEGDDDGYMVRLSTGIGSDDLSIVGDPGDLHGDTTSSILGGNGTDFLGRDSTFGAINDTGSHHLEMCITRWSADSVIVSATVDGKTLAGVDPDDNNADGQVYVTYDEIAFSWQGGGDYIVDNILLETHTPGAGIVPITVAAFSNIVRVSVQSQPGLSYELESSRDPATESWNGVGYIVTGNGGVQYMYDPSGTDTGAAYRIRGSEKP